MNELLMSMGINIASSAVYDFIKSAVTQNQLTKDQLAYQLTSYLNITNVDVAGKIIEFAAKNGDINISGTHIYADNAIAMMSGSGTKLTIENNSTSKTASGSEINVGTNASVEMFGGAEIKQNDDGSIKFKT